MTRLWPTGDPITVAVGRDGEPTAFRWRERDHSVETVMTHWRVDRRWWTRRLWRDYFQLTTQTGLLVVIYHDLVAADWYLQRLFD